VPTAARPSSPCPASSDNRDQVRRSGSASLRRYRSARWDNGGDGLGARARWSEPSGPAVAAGPLLNDAFTSAARSMADCAESHIGRPDCLPDDPLFWIGGRDDVIVAFVDGDMIDGAVRV
jgi:hypothetical protein